MLKTITAIAFAATIPMFFAGSSPAVAHGVTDSDSAQTHGLQRGTTQRRKPLAYGYINADGSVASGSGNFTAVWDSTNQWYAITLTGRNFYYSNYSTVVTPSFNSDVAAPTCGIGSVTGQLLVACYDLRGARVQPVAGFDFGVF